MFSITFVQHLMKDYWSISLPLQHQQLQQLDAKHEIRKSFAKERKMRKKISASDFNTLMSGEVKVKIKMQTINLLSLLFALSNGISWKLNEQRGCRILRLHICDHINQMVVIADTMVLGGIQITRDTRGPGEGSIKCHVNF